MKKIALIFLSAWVLSCNQQQDFNQGTLAGLADLPENALKEPYESNPNLIKVTITETNGSKSVGDYLDGQRSGVWTDFHTNGVVKSMTSYVDGQKQGGYFTIDNTGQLKVSAYHYNGQLHGEWKEFNRNRVKEERTYINGKLEGMVKIYYANGNIMEEGSYANGVRDGISKWYDREGNVTIKYEYNAGELIEK